MPCKGACFCLCLCCHSHVSLHVDRFTSPNPRSSPEKLWELAARHRGGASKNFWPSALQFRHLKPLKKQSVHSQQVTRSTTITSKSSIRVDTSLWRTWLSFCFQTGTKCLCTMWHINWRSAGYGPCAPLTSIHGYFMGITRDWVMCSSWLDDTLASEAKRRVSLELSPACSNEPSPVDTTAANGF